MAPKELVPLLISLMLLTGVCNTLLTKYQDNLCVRNCDDPDPSKRKNFEQPVLQTLQMFTGEMGSWLFVKCFQLFKSSRIEIKNTERRDFLSTPQQCNEAMTNETESTILRAPAITIPKPPALLAKEKVPLKGWKHLLLSLPAMCDICGSTLMNVGLLFVVPSIYQMTRGALVLFVGLFSIIFLKQQLRPFQWFALLTVFLGVGIVGAAGAVYNDQNNIQNITSFYTRTIKILVVEDQSSEVIRTIIGVSLIAAAQVFTASQFVLEEFILSKYTLEPLELVGWEGLNGFSVTLVLMVLMHFIVGQTPAGRYGYFDMIEGWREMTSSKSIATSSILVMISIGGFNYFGLCVTQNVSSTARSTIDTCRTLFIWLVSLLLGWETFKWLQVLGFALLVYGTFLFNGLIKAPRMICNRREREDVIAEDSTEPLFHD
ncbi:unnamed protein product [Blumeria hordei]|uniref:Integral membrane protein n=1 Tax=Blumeria hordei TaxID=2867405 RepID=A0A383UVW0_BLUHO|nr:unnamed protein product [Blumeria hordei]